MLTYYLERLNSTAEGGSVQALFATLLDPGISGVIAPPTDLGAYPWGPE